MDRRPLIVLLATVGCAFGPRAGPAPDAPTESALTAAKPPDVCRASPASLRRIGGLEAGATTFGEVIEKLGRPHPGPSGDERACWLLPAAGGFALFAHGGALDQPIRSLALAVPDPEAARSCGSTQALPSPPGFEAGLRPGMSRAEVELLLGPVTVDDAGAFGRECCGLEQTSVGEKGPVYGFGCTAVLGTFRDGAVSSLLVSRYASPGSDGGR